MKRHIPIALLTLASIGCSSDPCSDVRTVEQALSSTCNAQNDLRPQAVTTCTPRAGTICTVVGTGEAGVGSENVAGTQTRTFLPLDVTIGPDNHKAYFLDWNNHTIREIGADFRVRTVAGTGELQDGEDPPVPPGAPRVATPALRHRLNHPTQMTFDAQGRLLIAAWHNSMVKRVLNVGTPGAMIEDLCGTGGRSFAGDGGPALMAVLDLPVGVAIHPVTSDVYISDQANQRVRKVDGAGIISTVVGNGMRSYTGDGGPALMASLNAPVGQAAPPAARIEFDARGNLYIADTGNNVIRRVGADGVITTVAGTGMAGATGDNGPARMAQLNGPTDIEVGPDGTLYIADTQNSCVRAVGADGVIRTVVGQCGTRGFRGDGAATAMALLDRPYGIETDTMNRLWIADTHNQRIRVVTLR